jgi:hypothetical protein
MGAGSAHFARGTVSEVRPPSDSTGKPRREASPGVGAASAGFELAEWARRARDHARERPPEEYDGFSEWLDAVLPLDDDLEGLIAQAVGVDRLVFRQLRAGLIPVSAGPMLASVRLAYLARMPRETFLTLAVADSNRLRQLSQAPTNSAAVRHQLADAWDAWDELASRRAP